MTKNPYKKTWQSEAETNKAIGWDEGHMAGLLDAAELFLKGTQEDKTNVSSQVE